MQPARAPVRAAREGDATQSSKLFREVTGMVLAFLAVTLAASLATYSPADPSFNHAVSPGYAVHNAVGLVGAYMADLLVVLFGVASYLWPLALAVLALGNFSRRLFPAWWRWLGLFVFLLCAMGFGAGEWSRANVHLGRVVGGGLFGEILHTQALFYLRPVGATLLGAFALAVSVQLMAGLTWGGLARGVGGRVADAGARAGERREARAMRRAEKEASREEARAAKAAAGDGERTPLFSARGDAADAPGDAAPKKKRGLFSFGGGDESPAAEAPVPSLKKKSPRAKKAPEAPAPPSPGDAAAGSGPPPLDFLRTPPGGGPAIPKDQLDGQARSLESCLNDFGIQGEVQDVVPGPVVTMFEYKPAPGVKISRIAGLSDDLALALRASAVRIEAPLAGRDTVGVEIPNQERQTVYLREIMESAAFADSKSLLSLALGKDIHGRPHVADLARMPHLLVAGATGQGKSVCLNSILLSFLYKATPDQVKLLLVDPKRIELSVYADIPHLVHPVVTDMALAKNALEWAVYEMEKRYDAMARMGVRNIEGFNKKLPTLGPDADPSLAEMEPLPYLVIVIDELADLMLTARKEVETSIVRLAQLARAAGIHMIIATQRPSVDVVTGLIKANFPSRIAFTVTSPQDSRTILDTVGANHLLGKGDMLFKPGGGKTVRLHGALVDEDEIGRVIDFWKARSQPQYGLDFGEWSREGQNAEDMGLSPAGGEGGGDGIPDDPVYPEAVAFVMEQGKASISLIQRRFRIGFNRAARFVEQMEQDGVIGPADGAKPRTVLKG